MLYRYHQCHAGSVVICHAVSMMDTTMSATTPCTLVSHAANSASVACTALKVAAAAVGRTPSCTVGAACAACLRYNTPAGPQGRPAGAQRCSHSSHSRRRDPPAMHAQLVLYKHLANAASVLTVKQTLLRLGLVWGLPQLQGASWVPTATLHWMATV
jgi:hypothetical protein